MVENDKAIDAATVKKQLLETLSSVNNEDKINFLVNRLVNIDVETSKARNEVTGLRQQAHQVSMLQKKVGVLEKTLSKTEVSKTKLEDLCRELNRSKNESDRNYKKLKAMEETNREAMESFKTSIGDIQKSVEERKEQAQKMEDVQNLTNSLSKLSGEYEKRLNDLRVLYEEREQTIKSMVEAKDEELQHLKTQVGEMNGKIKNVFQENVDLKRELMNSEQKVKNAIESELATRKMFESYSSKYSELMSNIEVSGKAFDRAKTDMTKMNAQLIKFQGDAFKSKKQLDEANKNLLIMSAEKMDFDKEIASKNQQIEKLKCLCRELQKGKLPTADDSVAEVKTDDSPDVEEVNEGI